MAKMIFVNLPVTDLARSTAFYEAIGAVKNPQFSSEETSCVVFSDAIFVMLHTHRRFAEFAKKPIADAHKTTEVLLALSEDGRDAIDARIADARAAGATIDPVPPQDFGWMYGRSCEDPDGHIWELTWLDLEAAIAATSEQEPA